MPVGIRFLLGITDCHAPSVLAMTTGTKHLDKSEFDRKKAPPTAVLFSYFTV